MMCADQSWPRRDVSVYLAKLRNHRLVGQTVAGLIALLAALATPGPALSAQWIGPTQTALRAVASISCKSPSFCAAGAYGKGADTQNLEIFDGTAWSATGPTDSVLVSDVNCASSSFCLALRDNGDTLAFDGTSWRALSPAAPFSYGGEMSCPSASFCAAIGPDLSNPPNFATTMSVYNGASWSAPVVILPNGSSSTISCPSASFCVAADVKGNVVTFNGTSWSSPINVDSFSDTYQGAADVGWLMGMACSSPSFCVATGYHEYDDTHGVALARRGDYTVFNGTAWSTPASLPTYSGWPMALAAISCPANGFCAGVSGQGVATFDGISWSSPTTFPEDSVGDTFPSGGATFPVISCSSSEFCMAADGRGQAMMYGTPPPAPVNTTPPAIAGTPQQGQTLSELHGSWANRPTSYSDQWEDCDSSGNRCSAIAGATGQTYALTSSDVGHTIRVQETANNLGGSSSPASSAATAVVQPPMAPPSKPANISPPVISGTPTVGQSLTNSTGAWSGTAPISYAYQWQLCNPGCSNMGGATTSSLKLTAADVGARVRVVVTASNSAGSGQAVSGETGPVATAGPTTARVKAALIKALAVSGQSAKIAQLLKNGGYPASFSAPSAGHLVLSWYLVPKGARLAKAKKPVLVATASLTFHQVSKAKAEIRLTANGRTLLKGAKHVKLTAKGSFAPIGGSTTSTSKSITLKR